MKISKGFCFERHLISSPDFYVSGDFRFLCLSPRRFMPIFRKKSVENWNSRENLKLKLGSINCLNDCVCLYEEMRRMGALPSVIQCNQLLSRVLKLAEYSAAIWGFQLMNIL